MNQKLAEAGWIRSVLTAAGFDTKIFRAYYT